MMKQTKINSFFQSKTNSTITPTSFTKGKAKEILEPLFIRPIPEIFQYKEQLTQEYELIDKNKFVPVFLQVRTILELLDVISEESGIHIPHIIRGSAGSSLVCYLLGITHIDPLRYGIQIARFMNHKRKDMPDIDIDVPYNRREEIFGKIASTWPGMVARISNYCMWSTKTALRESIKELLKAEDKKIPIELHRKHYDAKKILGGDEVLLEQANKSAEERKGTLRNYSKHCGGIVIFEKEGSVPEHLILQTIESNGTQFAQIKLNKDDTENQGYIKIDILSNRGLAQLAEICPDLPLTEYPVRDTATEFLFEKGLNLGITFGESRGMRKLFMEMKPRNVNDIAVALALIRPAAAAEGRKQEFLEKWKIGKVDNALQKPIIYDDDAISKIKLAIQCDSAEADTWRKAFAKGNARARVEFRQKMATYSHSQQVIDSVVDDLNQLVYYSFCKSHAFSYAQLVWALAYWKAHRPYEFWASALNHCHSEYRKWVHYREAKCSGLQLSRGPAPYKVGTKQGKPTLISTAGEQTFLIEPSSVEELREYGYWTTEDFLPSCGYWFESQTRLDGKTPCRFRGIIASTRTITRDWGKCTLICLGVDNRKYIDLILPKQHRADLFKWYILEGTGLVTKLDTVEVIKIKGVSLNKLINK